MSASKKHLPDRGGLTAGSGMVYVAPPRPVEKPVSTPENTAISEGDSSISPEATGLAAKKVKQKPVTSAFRSMPLIAFHNPNTVGVRVSDDRLVPQEICRQPIDFRQEPLRPVFLRPETNELHKAVVTIRLAMNKGLDETVAENVTAFTGALQRIFNQENFQRGFGFDLSSVTANNNKGIKLRREFLTDAGKMHKLNKLLDRLLSGEPPNSWMLPRATP